MLPLPTVMALKRYEWHECHIRCDCDQIIERNDEGHYDCACGVSW